MSNITKIDNASILDKIIVFSWLLLIFKPRDRFTLRLIVFTSVVFIVKNTITFGQLWFQQTLLHAYRETLFTAVNMDHFHLAKLWLGLWMVHNYNSRFTCAYYAKLDEDKRTPCHLKWTEERVVFTTILLITYLLAPIGCAIYYLATKTYFRRFDARKTINWQRPQDIKLKRCVSITDYYFLATKTVRFGDSLPANLRKFYRFFRGLIGATIGLVVLSSYAGYAIYCVISNRNKRNNTVVEQNSSSRWPLSSVRTHMIQSSWQSITTPIQDRDWRWKLKSYWLQICTFVAFAPNGENPLAFFRAMQNDFAASLGKSDTAGFYPFGDGIGVSAHKYVKAYLESRDPIIIKDYQTIGWSVSSSLVKYCDSTHIFLPNLSNPTADHHLLSRKIIHRWLAAFPHRLGNAKDPSSQNPETYQSLHRLVARCVTNEPSRDAAYLAVGETIFFLATGGCLTREERDAYLDCVKNPFTFLPDWLNFLVAGNHMENKGYASFETFQKAFARHTNGPALKAAFAVAEGQLSKIEVLRLVTSAFCLGAAPGPAKLTANLVQRLWSDQSEEISFDINGKRKEKMVDLFYENPRNFIKECARMNSILSMVSLLSNDNIIRDVKEHTGVEIPANTRVHCSLMDANNDPNEFTSPNEFNPRRSDEEMGKIMTWNGSESGIAQETEELRPPRYCPGHDLSLQVIEFIAMRFAPVVNPNNDNDASENKKIILKFGSKHVANPDGDDDESDDIVAVRELAIYNHLDDRTNKHYVSSLDGYTKLIMTLSKMALKGWNLKPPHGIDIQEPSDLPTRSVHLKRVDGARFVATRDEDDQSDWHSHMLLVNKILNSTIWPLEDLELQFNSTDDMIAWRRIHFPSMPPPNNPFWYGDSDELMSYFAFFGLACHHTRKVNKDQELNSDKKHISNFKSHMYNVSQTIMKDAYYVNDMTSLSLFSVRPPFERYGAAAYFDRDRRLIGIYLSERGEFITPVRQVSGPDNYWNYAKYMWRSSALAFVTIQDHLLVTHFIEANTLVNKTRQYLPATHPLRIFLKPFTYRTATINNSASTSLINEGGLCHRIWGFEHDEFLKVCDFVIAQYRFRITPDWIDDSMKLENNKDSSDWASIYPIADDLPAYWKIVRDYVRRFFDIEYGKEESSKNDDKYNSSSRSAFMDEPCERRFIAEVCKPLGLNGIPDRDRLIDVLTQLICACTGIHEHVGHVGDYLYDPTFIGTKLRRDLAFVLPSVQNYSLMLVLTVLTAMKMPGLIEDWTHLIPRSTTDDNREKCPSTITSEDEVKSHLDNYYLFKNQLSERAKKIDQRHKNQDAFPFQSFNPRLMECSVSV